MPVWALECSLDFFDTVRTEIVTELILERAGPVFFKTFLLKLIAFRLIPVICPARRGKPENCRKRYLIPDRAYRAIKTVKFQKLIPGIVFPDPLQFLSQKHFLSKCRFWDLMCWLWGLTCLFGVINAGVFREERIKNSDPPTLAFFWKHENTRKKKGASLYQTLKLKSLERQEKRTKNKEIAARTKKTRNSKKQGLEGRGR